VSLHKRLERLEDTFRRSARSVTGEALKALSDEELDALEEVLEEALKSSLAGESSGAGATFEDLYAAATERSRRALDAYTYAIEAVQRGEDLPAVAQGERCHLGLLERISAGDEEARREWERRDGYRIWQYYRRS
jgi:hypothetical protein